MAVDYHLLGIKTKELANIVSAIASAVADLGRYAGNMDIFWDGDANAAYIDRINRDLTEIGIIVAGAANLVNCAKGALELYIANEREMELVKEELLHGT